MSRVFINGVLGVAFSIANGSGQGDPALSGRFNVGTDPLLRALNLVATAYRYIYSNKLTAPVTGYADDHLHPLKVQNAAEIMDILAVYNDFQNISGLKINICKTTILGINRPRQLL